MSDRMRDARDAAAGAETITPGPGAGAAGRTGPSRRRVLAWCAAAVALPPVLAACSTVTGTGTDDTEVVLGLADAARADAALVVAAVTADPSLAGRLEPLRAARIDHAAALDAAGGRAGTPPPPPPAPDSADVARVRDAVLASARAAADAVPKAPTDRVGLLAEISACCATYGAVLA